MIRKFIMHYEFPTPPRRIIHDSLPIPLEKQP